jgi:hypothetical protein
MKSVIAMTLKNSTALPNIVAVVLALACIGFGWQMLDTHSHAAATTQTSVLEPTVASRMPDADHAQTAAAAHIFGAASPTPAESVADEVSGYKVTGIACVGDSMHCEDQQVAVATLTGPDGDTVVHVGSPLAGGTVSKIDPYVVVISSASGTQDLKFAIPAASLDERSPVIPLEGSGNPILVIHVKAPEARTALAQNMAALQAALTAARAKRKALEEKNKQETAAKTSTTGSGPVH